MKDDNIIQLIIEAVSDEPEFPGEPPEDLMQAILTGDRELVVMALRTTVKLTKLGILDRIKERLSDQS